MKKFVLILLAVSLCVWMSGCATSRSLDNFKGGGGGGSNGFQAGNWALNLTGSSENIWLGGYLSQSSSTVSGTMAVASTQCFGLGPSSTPVSFTGTISGTTLVMTGTRTTGETFTLNLTLPSTGAITTMTGNYSIAGGTCANSETGSITGAIAANDSGNWSGSVSSSGGTMTINFTEATSPTNGLYPLTANGSTPVTFTGVTGCTVTGSLNTSLNDSFSAGSIVFIDINTTDSGVAGNLNLIGILADPTAPTQMNVSYFYTGGSGCFFSNSNQGSYGSGVLTMTKQ